MTPIRPIIIYPSKYYPKDIFNKPPQASFMELEAIKSIKGSTSDPLESDPTNWIF